MNMESYTAMAQREAFVPSPFTKFLWWLATAEPEILQDCVVDRNRYRIIGMSVLGTWLFATFTWMYFFSTMVSAWMAVPLGIFMGGIILSIDRALIKGITRNNKRKVAPLLLRGILALTIGTFMAQPAILYMFDKEIRLQIAFDNEKRKTEQRTTLENGTLPLKTELLKNKKNILDAEAARSAEVDRARQNFLAETDGTGGTGKVGVKDVAMAKRNEYLKLEEQYKALLIADKPALDSIEARLTGIYQQNKAGEQAFSNYLNDGFLTRIEALSNLLRDHPALYTRYYLIVFILMLIELMPVLAKILLPSGSYDEKVALRESGEISLSRTNAQRELDLKEMYNSLAHEHDQEAIRAFFDIQAKDKQERLSLLKQEMGEERPNTGKFWEKIKKDILTSPEN